MMSAHRRIEDLIPGPRALAVHGNIGIAQDIFARW
jgi:hypothetical protein